MRKTIPLLLILLTGCGPFAGTRYADIPAEQYNYLKGQHVKPEELGIQVVQSSNGAVVNYGRGASGLTTISAPLRLQGGAVTTPVEVNGKLRVPALIDTGAPFNLASLTLAYRLDLPVTRPPWLPQRMGGYGGASAECGWSILKSLKVDGILITNVLTSVPLEKFERVTLFGNITVNNDQFLIFSLDELIRMSYVTFDFPRRRFIMSGEKPFIAQAKDSLVVPCFFTPGPRLFVWIKVDGKGPFPCLIDTGKTFQGPALTIPEKVARDLGYWKETGGKRSDRVGIGGSFETQKFTLKNFEMGGSIFNSVTADTHEGAGEFILGASFFRHYRMTIDFRLRTICFEKA